MEILSCLFFRCQTLQIFALLLIAAAVANSSDGDIYATVHWCADKHTETVTLTGTFLHSFMLWNIQYICYVYKMKHDEIVGKWNYRDEASRFWRMVDYARNGGTTKTSGCQTNYSFRAFWGSLAFWNNITPRCEALRSFNGRHGLHKQRPNMLHHCRIS